MFDHEHSPIWGRCSVEIRENVKALFIIPVVQDHFHHIGVRRGDLCEHIPGNVGTTVAYTHFLGPQQVRIVYDTAEFEYSPLQAGSCQSRRPSGTLVLSDETQQEVPDGHGTG